LFSSTTWPGHTRTISASFVTTAPRASISVIRISNARPPSRAGWPSAKSSRRCGRTRNRPLEQIGVTHIFGLIGDSLNPIADVVRHSKIEWIGVRHEEGAALAAAGQAKLTGRLGVCCGTTGPGSTHLVAGLYEASRDHAPVLALSGAQDAGHRVFSNHKPEPAIP
jgi:hypothetical protein